MISPITRVGASFLVMAGVALIMPAHVRTGARLLTSWNAGVLTFLAMVALAISGVNASVVRSHSQRAGVGRSRVLFVTVLVCVMSLVAVGFVLNSADRQGPAFRAELLLSVATVFNAWLLLQTMFALHYVRYYYGSEPGHPGNAGGLQFAGEDPPDYWDFVYFSFVIGTSYSTSDTTIVSRTLRRTVLFQSVVSFLFFTILVGLVMNAVGTLF